MIWSKLSNVKIADVSCQLLFKQLSLFSNGLFIIIFDSLTFVKSSTEYLVPSIVAL